MLTFSSAHILDSEEGSRDKYVKFSSQLEEAKGRKIWICTKREGDGSKADGIYIGHRKMSVNLSRYKRKADDGNNAKG
ncbi:hypothetical protein VNO78_15268 [Psophocarpus tetragonolobus]|uniref:Uncharacterized protein n=1 Tax=Psophocarpus tetragonolobus TaxID=3891 RepID=A0AAN9SEQ1_PSOTE